MRGVTGRERTGWRCMKGCSACPLVTSRKQQSFSLILSQLLPHMSFSPMILSYFILSLRASLPWTGFLWSKRYFIFTPSNNLVCSMRIFELWNLCSLEISWMLLWWMYLWIHFCYLYVVGRGCTRDLDSNCKDSISVWVFELVIWVSVQVIFLCIW